MITDTIKNRQAIQAIKSVVTFQPMTWNKIGERAKKYLSKRGQTLSHTLIASAIWQCLDCKCIIEKDKKLSKNPEYYKDEYSGLTDADALRLLSKKYLKKKSCKDLVKRIAKKLDNEKYNY